MATLVILATLSIPPGAGAPSDLVRHLDMEDVDMAYVPTAVDPIAQSKVDVHSEFFAARDRRTQLD